LVILTDESSFVVDAETVRCSATREALKHVRTDAPAAALDVR